jgi:hypothetical protein
VRSLKVEPGVSEKQSGKVFDGMKPLSNADVFACLPFEISMTKHIVAVYVATYDAVKTKPGSTILSRIDRRRSTSNARTIEFKSR